MIQPPLRGAAQRAVSLFSKDPDEFDFEGSGMFTMTLRLPSALAATIAVMAEHSGQSRNEMAQLIIRAGLETIDAITPDAIRAEIQEAVSEQIENFI